MTNAKEIPIDHLEKYSYNEILKRAKSGSASVKIHTPKELRDMDAENKRLAEEHANRPDYDLGMTEHGMVRSKQNRRTVIRYRKNTRP